MAKRAEKKSFVCKSCGALSARWEGRCTHCGEWNCIEELAESAAPRTERSGTQPVSILELSGSIERTRTGMEDLDQVLGGGLVAGSLLLLGGEPGVGKSTLVLEIARKFPGKILYFSGEESPEQLALRARRLEIQNKDLFVSRETDLEAIVSRITREKPALACIDSIQTVQTEGVLPGSPGLLREAAMKLLEAAKSSSVPVFITGHITKDGAIAGPRLLEHMVDTVLLFESDRAKHYRILRAVKNRFGPVGELAIFEMHTGGLKAMGRPLLERSDTPAPGRVYSAMQEGSRSLSVEVQALVSRCYGGPPRRMAEGLDNRRLILLSAVLEKYLRVRLSECDVFANLAGGLSSDDPALDLAVCAAVLSSSNEKPVAPSVAFLGEVGLAGEVRSVSGAASRLKELAQMGFETVVLAKAASKELGKSGPHQRVRLVPVESVLDLAGAL